MDDSDLNLIFKNPSQSSHIACLNKVQGRHMFDPQDPRQKFGYNIPSVFNLP